MEIVKFAVSVCFFREKRCGKHCSEPVETRWKTGGFGKMPNGEEEKKHQTNQNPAGYTQFHRVRENVDKSIVKIPTRVL